VDRQDLERRIALARTWLDRWAPPEAKFAILDTLPADLSLTPEQKRFVKEVRAVIGTVNDPEAMQQELYEAAKRVWDGKAPRDAFEAIYKVFLGKPNGPKAAWLLTTLSADEVRRRLDEASR
jgi:lysyl-tRNA synthetase class 1